MGVLSRIRRIINANLNELLDKVESPETTANQMVREMEQAIIEVRRETAAAMARRKMTEKRLQAVTTERDRWLHNAESAVTDGSDDLARQALERKLQAEDKTASLRAQVEEQTALVGKLKAELRVIQDKVQEVRRKRDTLVSKKRATEARQRLLDHVERAGHSFDRALGAHDRIINGFDELSGWEEEVDQRLFEVEAREELRTEMARDAVSATFADLQHKRQLDDELKQLKEGRNGHDG